MIAIRGAVHHLLGPLVPAQGRPPQFAQLYIIDDPEQQVQSRIEALGKLGPILTPTSCVRYKTASTPTTPMCNSSSRTW